VLVLVLVLALVLFALPISLVLIAARAWLVAALDAGRWSLVALKYQARR
jgi:hypothetical protein